MNRDAAKELLLLHRPGLDDPAEPDTAEALALAASDSELRQWFAQHNAVQSAVFDALDKVEPPDALKEQIVSETRARLRESSRRKTILAGAGALALAVIMICAGIQIFSSTSRQNSFAYFRNRMVGDVQRAYPQMDLETSNAAEIRAYLAAKGQGAYRVPVGLEKATTTGCKVLRWHNQQVTMICYNSGKTSDPKTPDLFLFVIERAAVKLPNDGARAFESVGNLATATWTESDKVYLLAGSDQQFLKSLL